MVRAKNLLNPFKKLEPLGTKSLRKLMKKNSRIKDEDEDEDEALGWWRFLNYGYDETWKEDSIKK